ncbi:MAG: hypothetical protein JNL58_20150 [Planctomyces sp.]|nr:hypothetical protein [Planctomyces sp.]
MNQTSIQTQVLVLTTEGFEPDLRLTQSPDSTSTPSKQLDLSAICFEQFFLQNISPDRIWMVAGPVEQWDEFNAERNQHQVTLQLILSDSESVDEFAEVLTADDIVLSNAMEVLNDFDKHPCSKTRIVWIHLRTPFQDHGPTIQIINRLQALRHQITAESSTPCVLIVAPLRGQPTQPEPPFQCGFAQHLSQVPLWVDMGDAHMCRIQQAAGSYDLLPTVLDFCLLNQSVPQQDSKSQPLNLRPWTLAPGLMIDRTIKIVSVDQIAEVSRILLSVTTTKADNPPETAYFRKPEDVWNVNPIPLGGDDYNEHPDQD